MDDFYRYTWLYPLKQKYDFFQCFVKFQKEVENHFDKKIKTFQRGGGGEFTSIVFRTHLEQHGIHYQLSCPYIPQQNEVVEIKHRHIKETGLTLLFRFNVPMRYWIDAFYTTVYLINQMPTYTLKMDSSFYKIFNKEPYYNNLKVFGCKSFSYLQNYSSNKFSKQTYPCVFIGYSPSHK